MNSHHRADREFPSRPVVGVGGIVIDGDAVLMIRRAVEPLLGEWSIPGGAVEAGETLREAVIRELREETGLDVRAGEVAAILDRMQRAADGRLRYHYVIVDYVCAPAGGELRASSDAGEARWVPRRELAALGVRQDTIAVIDKAFLLPLPD